MSITTAKELADKARDVALHYKTLYIMGCFGAPMTSKNKSRYSNNNAYNRDSRRQAMINAASSDTFGFDCVCLIKGLLWGWTGDTGKNYGGAVYKSNGVPDLGADGMIKVCSDISTDFSNIAVGEVVWMSGHIGIYIGDGLAVECTPIWGNNVQITACNCTKAGYNRRIWTKHGKLPYVTYTANAENVSGGDTPTDGSTGGATSCKVGDIVQFKGSKHYTSANASSGSSCKAGPAKITAISAGAKHPYHVIHTDKTSNVYGWVDAADIGAAASGSKTHKVVKGDTLSALAKRYGTTVAEIVATNKSRYPMLTNNYIVVGWILEIPD